MPASQTRNLAVIAVAALVVGFGFLSLFKSVTTEKNLRSLKEKELAMKVSELAKKDEQVAELTRLKDEIESKLKSSAANVADMAKGYDAKIKELTDSVEMLTRDNESLARENESNKKKAADLGERIRALEAEKYELSLKIRELEAARESLMEPSAPVQQGYVGAPQRLLPDASAVELGKIVVQKNSGNPVMVQHVDRVYGFILFNAGERENVKRGDAFNISRDGALVTRAVVQRTRDNVAAAVILPEWTRGEVMEGDLVSRA